QVGYIVGAFNLIFRTTDGGQNWIPWLERTDNHEAFNLYAINRVGNALFIVGEQGLILKLDPVAEHFTATSTPYRGTFFGITGNSSVALAFGLRGNAYRSVDGGMSWKPVDLSLNSSITSGTVAADGRVILVSQGGHVLVSQDNAASFQLLARHSLGIVAAARFSGPDALTLAGTRGVRAFPIQ
ncbi:MAG: YCF48-related protein, partial [Pseudomonas sp.]